MTSPTAPTVADIGERAVIDRVASRVPAAPPWVSIGIGDDAAVVRPARNRLEVITTDALVEGVHFDRAWVPAEAIGHKALAVNLSDLAAMGAEPRGAVLSLILPHALPVADLDALLDGWTALARRYDVTLVGGNVSRSPGPLVVDVTVFGAVKSRSVLSRSGARPGDGLYVSGTIGAAYAGFLSCQARAAGEPRVSDPGEGGLDGCEERFLRPDPRVRLGLLLARNRVASSCVDLSDGLGDAVRQVAAACGVGAKIDAGLLPLAAGTRRCLEARAGRDAVEAAISGGEDYELLFTVPPRRRRALAAIQRLAGSPACTRIGAVTADRGLVLGREGRERELPGGFAHFR